MHFVRACCFSNMHKSNVHFLTYKWGICISSRLFFKFSFGHAFKYFIILRLYLEPGNQFYPRPPSIFLMGCTRYERCRQTGATSPEPQQKPLPQTLEFNLGPFVLPFRKASSKAKAPTPPRLWRRKSIWATANDARPPAALSQKAVRERITPTFFNTFHHYSLHVTLGL